MLNFFKPPISIKKWIGITFLLLIFWLVILPFFYAPTLVRSIFLKDFYLEKLKFEQVNIYVNPQMNKEERKNIILLYQKSRFRIDSLFGNTKAKPSILVGNTNEVMQFFGNSSFQEKTGMTHLTPLGSYIVLSPNGTNIDVLSHELCHAELLHRLGWQTRRQKIPIWFDEGLAMLVDKRFEHWTALQEDWRNLIELEEDNTDSLLSSEFSLQNIQTTEQFFTENAQIHYFLAQEEVARWYKEKKQKGLLELIKNLQDNDFEENYKTKK
ncbi:hypothetical protein Fleli_3937 [Bernardetia litoralis DSM 6794]|uniref:Peptidase MA-like domain-containing protein n=1 Tax=Bernardetia litoralis (strain ATCC 23117 / DSM 6794 / NBRC 15988 / NCIMB 1366 / Fx l1 / Sio-4) TaxID=880071 RepID=I4AQK5_BERLS|nr:hypothetical protein [Bernardetia litoralis]AFM06240.1 hypothetical protein Fleli_3937 [Bernardetia litoralis DSM 6794]